MHFREQTDEIHGHTSHSNRARDHPRNCPINEKNTPFIYTAREATVSANNAQLKGSRGFYSYRCKLDSPEEYDSVWINIFGATNFVEINNSRIGVALGDHRDCVSSD